ncbi:ribonuclease E/G, partial [uncultured Corynebacterium sp.]|uniref:ribonuclease E/G n=1 Tax=uncultured Corynebacterium sp. TaxID=159447 RepID=UPI00260C4853
MLIQVVRDVFNADFSELIIDGDKSWQAVRDYLGRTSPELMDRVNKWNRGKHNGQDAFAPLDLDQQLEKAMARKVWLPSGGYLIIDHTEAMTVIDVNTGSFVGSGGNLEATVTENNLEAAEEIVRQLRLRDIGGMIVVDFIDMLLQQNQDLVLRRLSEFLGRDRTRHKLGEVTSLGLVQLTRKRLGTGLLETFSTPCEACDGRGFIMHPDPVEQKDPEPRRDHGHRKERQQAKNQGRNQNQSKGRNQGKDPERSQREDKQPQQQSQQSESQQGGPQNDKPQQGTRRRVRRVVRRGNPHATQAAERERQGRNSKASNSDIDSIVANARKRSAQEDPDEPSAANNAERPEQNKTANTRSRRRRRVVRSAHTARSASGRGANSSAANRSSYEEAKREFEESPRRKRQTRGNSKSDFAPRPEDFGVTNNNAEKSAENGAEKSAENKTKNTRSRGRRRRVVRKTN